MSTGRNEPCPCGSGRKFKHCCGAATASAGGPPTRADRDAAFDLLGHLAGLPRFEDDLVDAQALVWSHVEEEDDRNRLMQTTCGDLFTEWVWFDHLLHSGQTLAEYALARHTADLTPGGRRFLRACTAAPIRLLQVDRVEPGERVHVRDLVDHGPVQTVSERTGSQSLLRHDVLAARIADYDGDRQFEGVVITFPLDNKVRLTRRLRRLRARLAAEVPADPDPAALRRMLMGAAMLASAIEVADRPMPALRTTNGDQLQFAAAVFGVTDSPAVERALAEAPQIERNSDSSDEPGVTRYTWFDVAELQPGSRRILGSVAFEGSSLRVETLSMARARMAQQRFTELAPTALRFRAIEITSMEEVRRLSASRPAPEEVDPEIAIPLERVLRAAYYRDWLDKPVPALGNRTPREAATKKHQRATLLALVEGIEHQSSRGERRGRGFDTSFLRSELGLRRVPP